MVLESRLPEQAVLLAKTHALEVRIVDDVDCISIASEPSIKKIMYDQFYTLGRIWSFTVYDEYIDLASSQIVLQVKDTQYLPKLKEKHRTYFKVRITCTERAQVKLLINEEVNWSGWISEQK